MAASGSKSSIGGAAATGGFSYQSRVTAWFAVSILGDRETTPPWGLPGTTRITSVHCETGEPADDLLLTTSDDGVAFAQIKHSLNLEKGAESELASALRQLTKQYLTNRGRRGPNPVWARPLDHRKDRLLLIVGPKTSSKLREVGRGLLDAHRKRPPDQRIDAQTWNEDQKEFLEVLRAHVVREWKALQAAEPSDVELDDLVRLLAIQVLEVDENGRDETIARDRLRNSVVADPVNADNAWKTLLERATQMAIQHSSADAGSLRTELSDAPIPLKAAPAFTKDVERLRAASNQVRALLADYAEIKTSSGPARIKRPCADEIVAQATSGHVLVTGKPGAGKSGALFGAVETLAATCEVLCLAADRISGTSLPQLRDGLGLENELVQVLQNWGGPAKKYLVIDALDAARGEHAAQALRDLIHLSINETDWTVVCSIRKFDLRHSLQLREMFRGPPSRTHFDAEFKNVRHVDVDVLSTSELSALAQEFPQLQGLLDVAQPALKELLHVPFHVRLIADLLVAGESSAQLSPIKTQVELLDRYWEVRVLHASGSSDNRDRILKAACERMIADRKLQVTRTSLGLGPLDTADMASLLSAHVLREWQGAPGLQASREVLSFSHHVLFDYAVSRLFLRADTERVVSYLESNVELSVVIRPSLTMHLTHLWHSHRPAFWSLAAALIGSKVPKISHIIGPNVAAQEYSAIADLDFLLSKSSNADVQTVDTLLGHLVSSAIAERRQFSGSTAQPWLELALSLARELRPRTADIVRLLVFHVKQELSKATPAQLTHLAEVSQLLLEYAWREGPSGSYLVPIALETVCVTIKASPVEGARLIREVVGPRLAANGFAELRHVTGDIEAIAESDSQLAADIYVAAFGHEEKSEDQTAMGRSSLMAFRSTRRQDYQHACWELAEAFPKILKADPARMTAALVALMEHHAIAHHRLLQTEEKDQPFTVGTKTAIYHGDFSCFWGRSGGYSSADPMRMLRAFENLLDEWLSAGNKVEFARLFDIVVESNRLPLLWSLLLEVGSRHEVAFEVVAPLVMAPPILLGRDTIFAAGEFLKAAFAKLPAVAQATIEDTIVALPLGAHPKWVESAQRRLLGCVDPQFLKNVSAKAIRESVEEDDENRPLVSPVRISSGAYTPEDHLKDLGVEVDRPENRKILDLIKPVAAFADAQHNQAPSRDEIAKAIAPMEALQQALAEEWIRDAQEEQIEYAWGHLAQAAHAIARAEKPDCASKEFQLARSILLLAQARPQPVFSEANDKQFEDMPSWGSPLSRIEAAAGLISLARVSACQNNEVREAVDRLAQDAVAAVRYQIAERLWVLYDTERERFWRLSMHVASAEQNRGVVRGFVGSTLNSILGIEPNRSAQLALTILQRFPYKADARDLQQSCGTALASLYVYRDTVEARTAVEKIVDATGTSPTDTSLLFGVFRNALTFAEGKDEGKAARKRAFELLETIVTRARAELERLQREHNGTRFDEWPDDLKAHTRAVAALLQEAADEILFASGAFEVRNNRETDDQDLPATLQRFYREGRTLFDAIAPVGIPGAAHHLLEALEVFVPYDPPRVFLHVESVIRAGSAWGYQNESLAAAIVVRIVERYLADYRGVLQENEACRRALVEILDVFVDAGWPAARQLTYGLDEVFR